MNRYSHKARAATLAAVLLFALAGCGGGGSGGGGSNPQNPPPSGGTNLPPTISGTPTASVTSGQAYSFQPAASDPEGQTLTFSIAGKPSWATFNSSNGRMSGTPTAADIGSYSGIVISVSDGTGSATLPAFAVTVIAATATGSAKLSWVAPTTNEDGSPLTNLAGYRVHYGNNPGALTQLVDIPNASTTTVTIGNLSAGTWYFALSDYTNVGVESAQTAPVSKTIL